MADGFPQALSRNAGDLGLVAVMTDGNLLIWWCGWWHSESVYDCRSMLPDQVQLSC